jgi:hypothetical protein
MAAVIALLCAMPLELRPLRRRLRLRKTELGHVGRIGDRQVIATASGVGTALARAATARLLDAVDIDWVIVVGIAGAIGNQIPIGTLVFPYLVVDGADGSAHQPTPLRVGTPYGKLWTTDELLLDRAQHAELRLDGVLALDMETAAVAKLCGDRGRSCEPSATGPVTAQSTLRFSASPAPTAGRTSPQSLATWSRIPLASPAYSASPEGPGSLLNGPPMPQLRR